MDFFAPAAAQALYRTGKPDEALTALAPVVAANPHDAEAHMTMALIMLRRNAVAETIASLKACALSRPGEWIVERMRRDFQTHGRPPLQKDMAFRLGSFLRSNLNVLGPALPPERRRARHEFMNVVGSSYVRSFGGSPAFFPLFIGMGPTMLLLSEAAAAVTRRKFRENLKRVDASRNTMLIVGADPYYHVTGLQKAGAQRPDGAMPEDFAMMDAVAQRHAAILADAKELITGKVILLGTTPTHNDLMNVLSIHLNARLKALCESMDVAFVDWWDELTDPATKRFRDDYCAHAYPGDVHFTLKATRRFMELLKEEGLFSEAVEPSSAYEWSHVFECAVDASEKTRLWSEPSVTPKNAFQSHKVASSHLNGHIADLLTILAAQQPDQTSLMVNVREGFLPVAVPGQVHAGCLAFTDTEANLQVGRQVLDFYGRTDIQLEPELAFPMLDDRRFSEVVLLIHPDSFEADERRANEVLGRLGAAPSIIIGTPLPERMSALNLDGRTPGMFSISNRHIPEQWRNYAIGIIR
jgi:hypothetical protein